MGNLLVNSRDQKFVLFEQLHIEKLFSHPLYQDFTKEIIEMSISEAEKFAAQEILPTYTIGDREGVKFENGIVKVPSCFHEPFRKFFENGWAVVGEDAEVDGQGMPMSGWAACIEYFNAANFSFIIYPGLTWGAAGLIKKYGTPEQKRKYMYKMFKGIWAGTMCLTEPNAGSDVGAIKTKAKRLPDGKFSITGTKIFISSGDHDLTENIIHPVLARIEGDPPGTAGISLFIVPKIRVNDDGTLGEPNDITVGNIEHKMGIKASATCTLNFGDNGKCIGELLGKEREGMKIMFNMMNQARIEVGMQGLGHATTAYEHCLQYARERIQGRPVWEMQNPEAKSVPIFQHPDVRRMLLFMKSYVEGMRAMNYFVAFCHDLSRIATTEEESHKWMGIVELLTPVVKAFCSDKAVEVCSLAIDLYGGYGYICEYPVEQYLRDAKIACLYEGTNGIQALDLVGRKLAQNKGQNVMNLLFEIAATIDMAKKNKELKQIVSHLEDAHMAFMTLVQQFSEWTKGSNFLVPIIYARPFLMILGDLVVGWLLTQAAAIAHEKLTTIFKDMNAEDSKPKQRAIIRENSEAAFYYGKIASARYFSTNVLSQISARCRSIALADKTPIEIPDESFGI